MEDSILKIIFVTKNIETASAFERYIRFNKNEIDEYCYFTLFKTEFYSKNVDGTKELIRKPYVIENMNEVLKLLCKMEPGVLLNTLLILDYSSLYEDFKLFDDKGVSPIGRIFLMYPELKIWVLRSGKKDYPLFTDFGEGPEIIKKYQFLVKDLAEVLQFGIHLKSSNQLFDPTGIRNWIKTKLIREKIKFDVDNFAELHKSREEKFALTADEENHHALFWGYALYNFGYSVLPVTTATELESMIPEKTDGDHEKIKFPINLICRDYDLQFPDIDAEKETDKLYKYRGAEPKPRESHVLELKIGKFWKYFYTEGITSTWIVTQIATSNKIDRNKKEIVPGRFLSWREHLKYDPDFRQYGITIRKNCVFLKGQSKEIEGQLDLLECKEIDETFKKSRDFSEVSKKRQDILSHSIPAINGQIAEQLIKRAKIAFNNKNFLISALLTSEAIEILNGLSMSLAFKALHLKLTSEAELELNVIGIGNFKKNIKKRIFEIRRQIKRLSCDNVEAERNARMQIFNGLRKIYEENEQFDSAEEMYNEVLKAELEIKDINKMILNERISEKSKSLSDKKKNCKFKLKHLLNLILKSGYTYISIFLILLFISNDLLIKSDNFSGFARAVFPVFYFGLFFFVLISKKKKLLYTVIKSGTDFGRLFVTFVIFNIIIFLIYYLNFYSLCTEQSIALPYQTIISSLASSPDKIDTYIPQKGNYNVYFLIFIHIGVSVFYVGLLISALYRWFTRR